MGRCDWFVFGIGLLATAMGSGCASMSPARGGEERMMTYTVKRAGGPVKIDANWEKSTWAAAEPIQLLRFMGARPSHFPRVQAKVAYDDEAVYVIFRAEDRYVRAVAAQHDGGVWKDSCVEFFFTPAADPAAGYFNLEMNCGGTMLFHHAKLPRQDSVRVVDADIEKIEVEHTLPKLVKTEIAEPTTWLVEYRLPYEVISKYCPSAQKPAPGVIWRANFYKCGDDTSHPHWLTWSPVNNPKPDFHRPQDFGELRFE